MDFNVTFQISADTPEQAAKMVADWRVSPGAVLNSIMSAMPVIVVNSPQEVGRDGEVGAISVYDPTTPPEPAPPPNA